MQKTALDQLIEFFTLYEGEINRETAIDMAVKLKQFESNQIIQAFESGKNPNNTGETYYENTYKN